MRRALGLWLLTALAGCSLWADFDDECAHSSHCAELGAGFACLGGRCVEQVDPPDAARPDAAPDVAPDGALDPRDGAIIDAGDEAPDAGPDAAPDVDPGPTVTNARCPILRGATEAQVFGGAADLIGVLRQDRLEASADAVDEAVAQALAEIAASGALTRPLAVLTCDERGDDGLREGATHLVALGARVIVGGTDSAQLAETFATVLRPAEVAAISPAAGGPALAEASDGGLIWRTRVPTATLALAAAEYAATLDPERVLLVSRALGDASAGAAIFQAEFCERAPVACAPGRLAVARYPAALGPAAALRLYRDYAPSLIVLAVPADDLGAVAAALAPLMPAPVVAIDAPRTTAALTAIGDHPAVACQLLGVTGGLPSPALLAWQEALRARAPEPPSPLPARVSDSLYVAALGVVVARRAGGPISGPRIAAIWAQQLGPGPSAAVGSDGFAAAVAALSEPSATVDLAGLTGPLRFDPAGDLVGPVEAWRFHLGDQVIDSAGALLDPETGPARPGDRRPDTGCAGWIADP